MITDYSHLDYPDNSSTKLELIKLIDILNKNDIHYWVDFGYLVKITTGKNDKFLNYLNSFDLCVFEESYNKLKNLLRENNFTIWNTTDHAITLTSKDLYLLNTSDEKYNSAEIIIQRLLKWVVVWNFKDAENGLVSLKMDKDFLYNKELFSEVEEVEYCGLKLKIPKHRELLFKIRYPSSNGTVLCHAPKKREECEKKFSFCNLGNYK
jgi:hypothetical protein